jgi:hypothetical protein
MLFSWTFGIIVQVRVAGWCFSQNDSCVFDGDGCPGSEVGKVGLPRRIHAVEEVDMQGIWNWLGMTKCGQALLKRAGKRETAAVLDGCSRFRVGPGHPEPPCHA